MAEQHGLAVAEFNDVQLDLINLNFGMLHGRGFQGVRRNCVTVKPARWKHLGNYSVRG